MLVLGAGLAYSEGSLDDRLGELVEARGQLVDTWIANRRVSSSLLYYVDHFDGRTTNPFGDWSRLLVSSCDGGGRGGEGRSIGVEAQGCLAVHGELESLCQCSAVFDSDMTADCGVAHVVDKFVNSILFAPLPERVPGGLDDAFAPRWEAFVVLLLQPLVLQLLELRRPGAPGEAVEQRLVELLVARVRLREGFQDGGSLACEGAHEEDATLSLGKRRVRI